MVGILITIILTVATLSTIVILALIFQISIELIQKPKGMSSKAVVRDYIKELIGTKIWDGDQVESLIERQDCDYIHPYTCTCGAGEMIVKNYGLFCKKCGRVQTQGILPSDLNWEWKRMISSWDKDELSKLL